MRPLLAELPLILAAAEPLASIYRSVNGSANLLAEGIAGNPEGKSAAELAAAARPVLDSLYAPSSSRSAAASSAASSEGRGATDLTDVARAATFGADRHPHDRHRRRRPGLRRCRQRRDHPRRRRRRSQLRRRRRDRPACSGGRVLALRRDDIPSEARSRRSALPCRLRPRRASRPERRPTSGARDRCATPAS